MIMILITLAVFFIVLILFLHKKGFVKNLGGQCATRLSKNKSISDMCDQSDELEDWSNNDVTDGTYSFKSGVVINYDKNSKEDRHKNLVVEVLNDDNVDSNRKNLKKDQIFISPIFRFYTQGEKFEKPVTVSLPHSAVVSEQKTWDIEILCRDERKGKGAKWERKEDNIKINWKDASFVTDTLLTYAVVGKPLKGAKKRMQFVVFAMKEMISDLFEVTLYLLDDNESSFHVSQSVLYSLYLR
jgi:hypothetical protein